MSSPPTQCAMQLKCVLVAFILFFTKSALTFENLTIEWTSSFRNNATDDFTTLTVTGKMDTLYSDMFKGTPLLLSLNLTNVSLKSIEPGTFKNLRFLEILNLGNNELGRILSGTFVDLPSVTHVNLSANHITDLESGAFRNMSRLTFLYLSNNRIERVRSGVFGKVSMRVLDLSNNAITDLEDGFLGTVATVSDLNLYLSLSNNKLSVVESLSHPNVSHLYLANNSISILKKGDFSKLPRLQNLDLSFNQIKDLQSGVFDNPKLEHLDLAHNQINFVSTNAFDNLPQLKILKIDNNKITKWDRDWFQQSPFVSTILAQDNLIEELQSEVFLNHENSFFYINLARNKIKKIDRFAFYAYWRTRYLHYLSLRDNEIEEWSKVLLNDKERVKVYGLDLRGNKLKCFGDLVLDDIFGGVEVVWLEENLFEGECSKVVQNYTEKHQNYKTPDQVGEEMGY